MTRKTKTPALSTQLKTALAEIETLKKKLDTSEGNVKYHNKRADDYLAELNAVHTLLDAMPNPPARVSTTENSWGGKSETSIPAATRVSVLLATR